MTRLPWIDQAQGKPRSALQGEILCHKINYSKLWEIVHPDETWRVKLGVNGTDSVIAEKHVVRLKVACCGSRTVVSNHLERYHCEVIRCIKSFLWDVVSASSRRLQRSTPRLRCWKVFHPFVENYIAYFLLMHKALHRSIKQGGIFNSNPRKNKVPTLVSWEILNSDCYYDCGMIYWCTTFICTVP